jgi:hypothetical protein
VYLKRGMELAMVAAQGLGTHNRFGHNNKDMRQALAKHMGIKIGQGKMKPCEGCTAAKA